MARNLQERLEAAKSPRARIADNEALLVDLKTERERLQAARDQASAESVDFALSDADRDESAAKAARLDRTIKSLAIEMAAIAALTDQRRSEDARKAAEAEKRAALTERDEIATRFAERVPAITAELISIFETVTANEQRMRAASVHEANAEWKARGIQGNGFVGSIQALSYRHMKIPAFSGTGRSWPTDVHNVAAANAVHYFPAETTSEDEERAKAAAKFAAEHGHYEISAPHCEKYGFALIHIPDDLVTGSIPAALGPWDKKRVYISHKVAEQLAKVPRLQVKRLDKGAGQ